MDNSITNLIGEACHLIPRPPVGTISSENEARAMIAWADAALELAYSAGDLEVVCDMDGIKRSALALRYEGERFLAQKKLSDIVSTYRELVGNLREVCKAVSPGMEGYLEFRLEVNGA
jgi:hypothetical protein